MDAIHQNRDSAETLAKARGYPYSFPRHSFTYRDGGPTAFDEREVQGRIPVLAIGSNQSPVRLQQKYGHLPSQSIPVQRAQLADFDILYCAHVTRYGAIGAMLQHCPGAAVELAVNWLDAAQLDLMHATEGNYDYCELNGISLALDGGRRLDRAYLYVGRAGHMLLGQRPVAMAAVTCRNRRHPAMTTADLLGSIQRQLHPRLPEDDFILRLVTDEEFRLSVTASLGRGAIPFQYPCSVVQA